MKKLFLLLSSMFLLVGCIESVAVIGGGAANGNIVQSSFQSGLSYGVKKQTGKSPLEHALAYAGEKNPNNKKEKSDKTLNQDLKIPEDSSARITSSSLLGGNVIEIIPGSSEEYLKDNDIIFDTRDSVSFTDLLGKLVFSSEKK